MNHVRTDGRYVEPAPHYKNLETAELGMKAFKDIREMHGAGGDFAKGSTAERGYNYARRQHEKLTAKIRHNAQLRQAKASLVAKTRGERK
ncbi:MAG: hypothetical protein ABIH37_04185 [archaeon]